MWVCLNDAFLSIVSDRDSDDFLLVRGRLEGDIERVFPCAEGSVAFTPDADYAYRVRLPRQVVANAIASRAFCINYPNFKNSVADARRHDAYERFWSIMVGLQNSTAEPGSIPWWRSDSFDVPY